MTGISNGKRCRRAVKVGRLAGENVGVGPFVDDESSGRRLLPVASKGSFAAKSWYRVRVVDLRVAVLAWAPFCDRIYMFE
ncbi:hypothetical protein DPMN_143250 [Dreissena polymorpha]|uniref:Uncharacterized protein n=1 Tax=Dreissena polymorpha TaxID=45954 RepID=A0A9D4GGV4_DREPO|nr:hypothetical protein DPMN_143250 [Dreissena polymorpha]